VASISLAQAFSSRLMSSSVRASFALPHADGDHLIGLLFQHGVSSAWLAVICAGMISIVGPT
jgi:hypothetical protein